MILIGEYEKDPDGPKALAMLVRVPGQRWHHLACFGRKSHYFADGSCAHTEAVLAGLTDYGKRVTKLEPFGAGRCVPKRYADRVAA